VCSGFGYGKEKLREGGNQVFWFFRCEKLGQGLGGEREKKSFGFSEEGNQSRIWDGNQSMIGTENLLQLPKGKDHGALVLG
jgi:hypothetical protein